MVGGGADGFIGDVHRHAMALDGLYSIVAGVFSRDAAKSQAFGTKLGIAAERLYQSFEAMADAESKLPEAERMEVVVIVTPTPAHASACHAFISRGFSVVCDKPLATDVAEADNILRALSAKTSVNFMLIHNYSGYPMVKQARSMVASGKIGDVTKVIAEYEQGWLCEEAQLSTTTSISSLADVGTHALQLLQYVTGLQVDQVCADVGTMFGGARSPDDANMLLRLSGGRRGVLIASQASAGQGNGLRLKVYGKKGGLIWEQESPERLQYLPTGSPAQILVRGGHGLSDAAQQASRIPGGHPEGFLEAFANLYKAFYNQCCMGGDSCKADFPKAADGRDGLAFIAACMESAAEGKWVSVQNLDASVKKLRVN
jgi:predicted dehydrogenase